MVELLNSWESSDEMHGCPALWAFDNLDDWDPWASRPTFEPKQYQELDLRRPRNSE